MAAKKDVLSELHQELAQQMLDELRWYRENEIPVPAADKAAMAKFLKDNSVTADPADAGDLEKLREQFREQSAARRKRAAEAMAGADDAIRQQLGLA